jgi:uncharacterized protein YcfL
MKKALYLGILFLVGCSSTQNDSPPADNTGTSVAILNENLRKNLTVDKVGSNFSVNHLMVVHALIHNKTKTIVSIQVQTLYQDANGNPLNYSSGNEASWTTLDLISEGTQPYRSQSISPKASKFIIRIRNTQKSKED